MCVEYLLLIAPFMLVAENGQIAVCCLLDNNVFYAIIVQPYQPGYTAPPSQFEATTIDIG